MVPLWNLQLFHPHDKNPRRFEWAELRWCKSPACLPKSLEFVSVILQCPKHAGTFSSFCAKRASHWRTRLIRCRKCDVVQLVYVTETFAVFSELSCGNIMDRVFGAKPVRSCRARFPGKELRVRVVELGSNGLVLTPNSGCSIEHTCCPGDMRLFQTNIAMLPDFSPNSLGVCLRNFSMLETRGKKFGYLAQRGHHTRW